METKTCKECGETKPVNKFASGGKNKYRNVCKICRNEARREYNKINKVQNGIGVHSKAQR
jgi:preprotein translocase subunit Sss1